MWLVTNLTCKKNYNGQIGVTFTQEKNWKIQVPQIHFTSSVSVASMAILSGTTELQISKSSPLMQNSLFLFQSRAYGLRKRLKINKKNGVGNRTKASFSNSYNSLISPSLQLPTHMYRFVFELLFDGRTPQHSLLGDCSRKM